MFLNETFSFIMYATLLSSSYKRLEYNGSEMSSFSKSDSDDLSILKCLSCVKQGSENIEVTLMSEDFRWVFFGSVTFIFLTISRKYNYIFLVNPN